jgi:hypothetical protein
MFVVEIKFMVMAICVSQFLYNSLFENGFFHTHDGDAFVILCSLSVDHQPCSTEFCSYCAATSARPGTRSYCHTSIN